MLAFIASQRTQVIRDLRAQMEAASEARKYERAASMRDQLRAIEKLDEREHDPEAARAWQPEVTVFATDPSASMRSLNRLLGGEAPIRSMEAIDIAHLGGSETVGAKVCFIDGKPFKDAYRRYRIRTADNDDYQSMREVVSRGYRKAGNGETLFPDLVLIDGGQGQLAAAQEAFAAMPIQPPLVVALAKKEEVLWVQEQATPIRLGRTHPALKLCQAIRDEAHRFAGHYHTLLRKKALLEGQCDGAGPSDCMDSGQSDCDSGSVD
jgi:excinuclease ABC subunit C